MMTYWILPVEVESGTLVGGSEGCVKQRLGILLHALRASRHVRPGEPSTERYTKALVS